MSTEVDNRVVSMKFDNKQFESGVNTSINSLDNLKKGLNLSGSAKGLSAIRDAAKRVTFDGMVNGVEAVRVKFSALQVMAITTLTNITNSAVNAGKKLISSLTTEPIMSGFKEYETQMDAIQTILANTSTKGTTLTQVKESLAELNTYSDKTIYNFTEMTKNIGTFTAAGVALKPATEAIKGIANLAAVSGSNSQQASTAMYQLSQAMASGTVKLMDWNSVVNAGMGGEVFQNSLKETARVHGIGIDSMIKEEGSFRETLKGGWLTTSILTETLSKFTGDLNAKQLKALGYSEKQIVEIIKMGKMASDAATKVKTFSQLLDTLKEAAGSGWAKTWETLFGDFEEAKKLFTNVSNVLGGMIGASADARNNLLSGWKDLGGRSVLIDAIGIAFSNVMDVVKSLSGAFREIFPKTTSGQLFSFTVGLKTLMTNLTLSKDNLENLKSTFKGLFAILDIGKTILSAVFNAVWTLFGGVGDLGGGILAATASMGDWLVNLDNMIKKSNIFNKILQPIAGVIRDVFGGIAFVFDLVTQGVSKCVKFISENIKFPGFEAFHSFLGLISKRMSSLGEEVHTMGTGIGTVFGITGKVIAGIWNVVKIAAGGIGSLLMKMGDTLTNAFSTANFSGILDLIAGISVGGVALGISKFLKSITEPLKGLKGTVEGVTGILDGVRGSFEAYQTNLKAGTLLKIAIAIGILSASIVAISLVDSEKLVSSLAAIGTLFAQLLTAMYVFSKIGTLQKGATKSAVVMISMSIAILILSDAMVKLAALDWNGIAKGTVGISALAGVLVATAKLLSSNGGSMIKGASGMILFAAAIKVLASACVDLSKLSWEELSKGLVGVGVLCAEIALFLNTAKFSGKTMLTATGILILAAAMKVLASACSDFGALSWTEISKGLVSIGLLLAELSIFTNVTGNAKNVISTGIALVAIAAAMKILASAMSDFGGMAWDEIGRGLTAMGLALAEITIAVNLMPKNLPVTATGLLIVSAALNIMADALIKMGGMTWDEIGRGLTVMAGALTILSVALYAMTGTLAGSAALLVASGALAILAPVLSILGAMSWENIVKGLASIAGVFVVLGLSALVLTPLIPAIIALSGALVLLGVGMVGIGAGLVLVGVGLAGLATGFGALAAITATGATAIVAALSIIIIGVAALIPAILVKIGEGIIALCDVLIDGAPAICKAIDVIVKEVVKELIILTPILLDGVLKILSLALDSLIKWTPKVLTKVLDLLIALIKVINDYIPKVIAVVIDMLVAIIDGITDGVDNIVKSVVDLIITIIDEIGKGVDDIVKAVVDTLIAIVDGIAKGVDDIVQAAFDLIVAFIDGLTDAINENTPRIMESMDGLMQALINAAVDVLIGSVKTFLDMGGNLINGLVSGIVGREVNATGAIGTLLTNCSTAITNFIGEFVTAGRNVIDGFISGITSGVTDVAKAAANAGKAALNSAKDFLGIHSPSRKFKDEVGVMIGKGMANGIKDSSKEAESASKKMSEAVFNEAKEWIDDRKYYNQISLQEELYVWQTLQNRYKQGTEERKKADKEAYRVRQEIIAKQKELEKAAFDNSIELINDRKFYNKISLEEELKAWQEIQKKYKQGTEERKQADREVYTLKNELATKQKEFEENIIASEKDMQRSGFDYSVGLIDDKKYYNQLSLKEELAAWEKIQKRYLEGTEERKKADREVYRIRQELNSINKDYSKKISDLEKDTNDKRKSLAEEHSKNVEAIEKDRNDKITNLQNEHSKDIIDLDTKTNERRKSLEDDYYAKTKDINNKLAQDIQSLNDAYNNAVDSRTKSLYSTYGLFDAIDKKGKVTGASLIKNLQDQVGEFDTWSENIKELSGKGIDKGLISELTDMGPKSVDKIQALNSLSESELNTYVELWKTKHNAAKTEAIGELEGLRLETITKIADLNAQATIALDEYRITWQTQLAALNLDASNQLLVLNTNFANELYNINANSDQQLYTLNTNFNTQLKTLNTNSSDQLKDLKKEWVTKVGDIKGNTEQEFKTLSDNVVTTVSDLRTETEKEFTKLTKNIQTIMTTPDWSSVGRNIILGIVDGLNSKAEELANAAADAALLALGSAQDALGIQSPSKEFAKLGAFSGEGFIVGLSSYGSKIVNSAKNLGNGAVNAMSNAISSISDIVNSNIDDQPVIRPVFDLSDIQNGSKQLYSIMGGLDKYTVSGSINTANATARSIENSQNDANNTNPQQTIPNKQGSTVNFTQNNYSPTALSRLDIYRQTKNQISAMKGVLVP